MTLTTARRATACIGFIAASAGIVRSQQPVTRADVNGEWDGALQLEGGTHDIALVFELSDSAFVGQVYDGGRLFGRMEGGALSADTVKFTVDKLAFTGVIKGAEMKIALIVYNGSTRNFIATRKAREEKGH